MAPRYWVLVVFHVADCCALQSKNNSEFSPKIQFPNRHRSKPLQEAEEEEPPVEEQLASAKSQIPACVVSEVL